MYVSAHKFEKKKRDEILKEKKNIKRRKSIYTLENVCGSAMQHANCEPRGRECGSR